MNTSKKICLDGNGLAALLCAPVQPKPIVLPVHGLTGDKDQKGCYVKLADFLAGKGISNLRFDMRGRGETPGYLTPLTGVEAKQW
jgi:alpha-beta hydrolase superfamily lysophospholipase